MAAAPPLLDLSPVQTEPTTTFRLLEPSEVQTLAPTFEANGVSLPNLNTSAVVGALRDGKVVGFLVLQLCLHAEPMWIEPGHSTVFPGLVQVAEQTVLERVGACNVFLFAPAGRVAQMAQAVGMRVEPWVVLSKFVGGDTEGQQPE